MFTREIILFCLTLTLCFYLNVSENLGNCYCNGNNNKDLIDPSKANILQIIRALRDTIPLQAQETIYKNKYGDDEKFRDALKYIYSPDFDVVSDAISNSNQYQNLLQDLKSLGINTDPVSSLSNILKGLLYPFAAEVMKSPITNDDELYNDEDWNRRKRSLNGLQRCLSQSFASQLINMIPKQKFQQELSKYLKVNTQFAKLYKIVRQTKLQRKVLANLASASLNKQVRLLKQHNIDLKAWLSRIFKLISYGPRTV